MQKNATEQAKLLLTGLAEAISAEELRRKIERSLKEGKPLRIKAGFDPSSADIHLGHTVLFSKLRQFQDLGHVVVYIIGDATARIGDPSGRNQARPMLSEAEIRSNAATYQEQAFKILDPKKTETVYNNEWFGKMSFNDVMRLGSLATVSQILQREDFQKRLASGSPVTLMELFYPLMQAYDSVQVGADVEIGGTDQKFNLLMGRELQKGEGLEPQAVLMLPLLVGLDGREKMSKSLANHVGVKDDPKDMFGKIMSIPDSAMPDYYTLLFGEDGAAIQKEIGEGKVHPREVKARLASKIVERFHGPSEAAAALQEFDRVFSSRKAPSDIPRMEFSSGDMPIVKLLVETGFAESGSEAKRLLSQNAVSVDGAVISDPQGILKIDETPKTLKVGKRKFAVIVARSS